MTIRIPKIYPYQRMYKGEIALGFLHADGPLVLATDDRHSLLQANTLTHLVVLAED